MKVSKVSKVVYTETYGPVNVRTAAMSPENLSLLDKVKALSITEMLIVEIEKGEDIDSQRSRLYGFFNGVVKKMQLKFRVRFAVSRENAHIVIWKEAKA